MRALRDHADVGGATSEVRAVVIIDDDELVVRGVEHVFREWGDQVVVTAAGSDMFEPATSADRPVTGCRVGVTDPIAGRALIELSVAVEHLVFYTWEPERVLRSFAPIWSPAAVVSKRAPCLDLVNVIRRLAGVAAASTDPSRPIGADPDGDETPHSAVSLTPREREVLGLLACGYSNRRIADELYLSVDTVKTYTRRLFAKLGVTNRTQAALRAIEIGLARTPG